MKYPKIWSFFILSFLAGILPASAQQIDSAGQPPAATATPAMPLEGWIPVQYIDACGTIGPEARPYTVEPYLVVAARLQALPQDKAIAQLRQWAKKPAVEMLCRMLFDVDRTIFGGGMVQFVGDSAASNWPSAPFGFVDDVPFLVQTSFALPMAPPRETYLEYCIRIGKWSNRVFAPKDVDALKSALDKLLKSPAFARPLTEREIKMLTDQIAVVPYEKPSFWIQRAEWQQSGSPGFNPFQPADVAPKRVRASLTDFYLIFENGTPPYRCRLSWSDKDGSLLLETTTDQSPGAKPANGAVGDAFASRDKVFIPGGPFLPVNNSSNVTLNVEATDATGAKVSEKIEFSGNFETLFYRPVSTKAATP